MTPSTKQRLRLTVIHELDAVTLANVIAYLGEFDVIVNTHRGVTLRRWLAPPWGTSRAAIETRVKEQVTHRGKDFFLGSRPPRGTQFPAHWSTSGCLLGADEARRAGAVAGALKVVREFFPELMEG